MPQTRSWVVSPVNPSPKWPGAYVRALRGVSSSVFLFSGPVTP